METKLGSLHITPTANMDIPKSKQRAPVVDSWEDDSDTDVQEMDRVVDEDRAKQSSLPNPPPPTPASPQGFPSWNAIDAEVMGTRSPGSRSTPRDDNTRRQEKSTAVASRMIAAGLGVKAPKRTEEQRAYDRAAKEAEIRKRNRERQDAAKAEEEEAKIKDAVWDS